MIDSNAFGEWLVAKAKKQGAFTSAANLRVARDAVEIALARDGDEVHVICVLAGASSSVRVDERMTRTAIEVLFPKVANVTPEPLFVPGAEPPRKPSKPSKPSKEDIEADRLEKRREELRLRRMMFLVVGAIIVAICAIAAISAFAEHHEHDSSSGAKREMHH